MMNALTPKTLEEISKALATLHRAARLEFNSDDQRAQAAVEASFVVGGAILMLAHSVDGQANEWRDFMHAIDGRLNLVHNAMLDMTKAIRHGVRLKDSEREALRLAVQSELASIRDEVAEIPGAISEAGTDIGAGVALALEHALKIFTNENTYNG